MNRPLNKAPNWRHVPRKRFGQHFLCDAKVVQRIVSAISPQSTERIIEIGPGQGALTAEILKNISNVEAIEIDRDLLAGLLARCAPKGRLTVYCEDVLSFDVHRLQKDARPLRFVGNLPYNISTALVFHLLKYRHFIHDMVFLLQKEVAKRFVAQAGSSDYSRSSVIVQYHCKAIYLFDVSPSAFYPVPQVDSGLVQLVPYQTKGHVAKDLALFEEIIRRAFGQRRKTIRNSLKDLVSGTLWQRAGVSPDSRPQELCVADFVNLSNAMSS